MTVTYNEYLQDLAEFAQRHLQGENADMKVYTSSMENDRYHKEYCFTDGHIFSEVNERITDTVEIEYHGIKIPAKVEVWRTEYWSTEQWSKYTYCYTYGSIDLIEEGE